MNDVGLLYSHASRRIDRSTLYTANRYYVGVGGEFITFSTLQQEMKLPVFESRTADGLKIELEVSINYKVTEDLKSILLIYDRFGPDYDGFISRLAMNIIRDASARFTAFEYSESRSKVSLEMEKDIRDDLAEVGFTLDSVQLLNINFPSKFSNTLQNTLMLQQQVKQAEREKAAEIVSLEGELSKSVVTAQGINSDAKSQATTITENAKADAESLISTLDIEGTAHKNMIDMFLKQIQAGATPTEEEEKRARKLFVQWYWMNQVSGSPATKSIAVSVPSDLVNMPTA